MTEVDPFFRRNEECEFAFDDLGIGRFGQAQPEGKALDMGVDHDT